MLAGHVISTVKEYAGITHSNFCNNKNHYYSER